MQAKTRSLGLSLTVAAVALAACKSPTKGTDGSTPAPSASGQVEALPPLVVKDDTAGALFTWVDEQGDFHVVEKAAEVPEAGKQAVRVVVASQAGTGDAVYVADLTKKNPDGSYAVRTMARTAWDELGASKRKARLEALAPKPAPSTAPSSAPGDPNAPAVTVKATIYGASWCGPCHQAEALLKSLGVQVTKKDIEESSAAAQEMQDKLRKAHRSGGSIPVIDVMGQLFIGFSETALRNAVSKARSATL